MSEQRSNPSSSDRASDPNRAESDPDPARAALLPKIVPFSELARCGDEIWIEHLGQLYRLRQTRQGKLILTK
jgi:hemin uptake protein HemP